MGRLDERTELIGLIYEAALDRRVWPLVADRLADLFGATICQINTQDTEAGEVVAVAPRLSPDALFSYAQHWMHRNPLIAAGRRLAEGEVFFKHDLIPKDEFERTAIHNEFFAPLELDEGIGGSLVLDGAFSASFGIYRPSRMGEFDSADRSLLAGLIPHLQRALQLNFRFAALEMTRIASAELLDRLRQASLLVDATCRVTFANRAAEEILADRFGLRRGAGDVLRAERGADTVALHRLVAKAARQLAGDKDSAGGRLRLPRGETRAPLTVLVIPLRAEASWPVPRSPAVILFITDPERGSGPTVASLRHSFGLTRTEAAVALEVLGGGGLRAAAARLGVAPTTARTHLTAVFDKTGTRRQADLVRALLQTGESVREG